MHMRFSLILTIVAIAVAGCRSAQIEEEVVYDMSGASLEDVARTFGKDHPKQLRVELEKRDMFTSEDWDLINKRKIRLGATRAQVLATLGAEHYRRELKDAVQDRKEWVYGEPYNITLVMDKDVVTSIR